MKILLIGNGFDLEHSLPTSYNNFLEFSQKVKRIFTYYEDMSLDDYQTNNLNDWEIDSSISDALIQAFQSRNFCTTTNEDGKDVISFTTSNIYLNEFYSLISKNTWLDYFLQRQFYIGDGWIDFESEIAEVIKVLDKVRSVVKNGEDISEMKSFDQDILSKICLFAKENRTSVCQNVDTIDIFISKLDSDLNALIRALEIYISEFVNSITVCRKSPDIEKISPDHVLSFNYSNTYERIYGIDRDVSYDFIHGKADIGHNIDSCNLVLGINDCLDRDRKNSELEFVTFEKYYQRIYKGTDNQYLDWIDEIKYSYNEYVKQIGWEYSEESKLLNCLPLSKRISLSSTSVSYPDNTLYIFGHSLDATDGDVLRELICNENVQTKIFYYRKFKDDKSNLGKLIKNLIKIIGPDELVRRTGGAQKTIEFIPQALSECKQMHTMDETSNC